MVDKWCVVPQCTNTSINSPNKLFVSVPTNPKRRKLWLQLARRDPKSIVIHSNVFLCEDHFDMEKDTKNYMKYKIGFSQKILLADEAVPTKFYCRKDRKRRLSDDASSRKLYLKRQRTELVTECLQSQSAIETYAESLQKDDDMTQKVIEPEELPKTQDKETIPDPVITVEKSIQVTTKLNMHYRSKAVQTICQNKSISTSPFKSGVVKAYRRKILLQDEKSDSDISFESEHLSPFVATSSSSKFTDSDSDITDTNEDIEKLQCLKNTMRLIDKKPLMYIGITEECYFLIQLMHKRTNIKVENILLCLNKIRLNSTFSELQDNFGISLSYASKLFLANIPYLISCTPNGLVNYVSQGFGGRTSDVTIVENCNFLKGLQQGTCILADRGFKHLEQILHEKGMKLLRPPSVHAGTKLSNTEVRQTKIIASLRIHIERVIRRLREFHMLKQHSVINTNILRVLYHVIIIACALINLQDSFIK
ncbi:unnamed protein product [Euphydryas editha]|uniref:THAP-type domain-containing protein n=1 Tax=Euphydryas editha TaxID=104508 RepID=A0AAU9US87_EUPED|nr:unnamed protein product [Euphydryas editha]